MRIACAVVVAGGSITLENIAPASPPTLSIMVDGCGSISAVGSGTSIPLKYQIPL